MQRLLADADNCVKCGLCLPHCPTYTKTHNENESPRGRIALIQAVAGQHLPASEKLLNHIDNCLLCRACEAVCPATVPYSHLIDGFRGHYAQRQATLALSLLKKLAHNKMANRLAQSGIRLYQKAYLQKAVRLLKLPQLLRLDAIDRLLPDVDQPDLPDRPALKPYYAASKPVKGTVGLFTGCMGLLLDQETVHAAIKVLTALGFNVSLPAQQGCCGALAVHDGDPKTAAQLATINCSAFADPNLTAIITIASGCGSQLQDYQHREFANKVVDISQFLSLSAGHLSNQLLPLAASVCVHTPCSLKNAMHQEQGALTLLQQLPGITLAVLPETLQCCGSAGSYMLKHPIMAKALLNDILAVVLDTRPDYLTSSNIGCILHIKAGLKACGSKTAVLHPVVLIARQLPA